MCSNTEKGFENQSKDEKLKTINVMLDEFLSTSNDDEKMELMMNIMPKIMNSGIPFMKKMCESMSASMCDCSPKKDIKNKKSISISSSISRPNNNFGNSEIKTLFEDWVAQVQEEIKSYIKVNNSASTKEVAKYLKISEESANYFIKNC